LNPKGHRTDLPSQSTQVTKKVFRAFSMSNQGQRNEKQGLIVGIGNPLLDILATCDVEFVNRHSLQPGQTITNSDKYDALINELAHQYKVKFIAGGSAQNTIRVTQWLLHQDPRICTFIGCIGRDFFGQCMRARVEDEGVNVNYIEIGDKVKTGYCCVLAFRAPDNHTQQTSMITWLGAAHCFKSSHLDQFWSHIQRARIVILEGYFLEVCPDAIRTIAKHIDSMPNKFLCLNVGANYVLTHFWNEFRTLLESIDYLFLVPTELELIVKMCNWPKAEPEVTLKQLTADPPMRNSKKMRHVILECETRVLTASQGDGCKSYPIKTPNMADAKDNNGCRDAFVAGYLSGLMSSKPEVDCIAAAIYASQEILRQDGCTIPKHPPTLNQHDG
jgi:adenosine kinase